MFAGKVFALSANTYLILQLVLSQQTVAGRLFLKQIHRNAGQKSRAS